MNIPVYIKAKSKRRLNVGKEIAEVNRLRLNYERRLTLKFIRLFQKIGKDAASVYQNGGRVENSLRDIDDEVAKLLRNHYSDVIPTFARRVVDGYKLTPDLTFQQYIDLYYVLFGALKVQAIANTTRNQILATIFAAEADTALGSREIARQIEERTSGAISRSRALTIARTETNSAASWASHKSAEDMPLTFKKQWSSVGDARTRAHHAAMNGVEVAENEDFVLRVNGQEFRMAYTHDPRGGPANVINCRCSTLYIADDDEIFGD